MNCQCCVISPQLHDAVEVFFGRGCSPCARYTGQGNYFELIPMVQMESQHSVGTPIGREFPQFVIISQKSRPEVGSRWRFCAKIDLFGKKTPYGQISKIFSERIHGDTGPRTCAKFVKFGWPEMGKVVRYLPDKKNKFLGRSSTLASALIVHKICQGQWQTIYSECPNFIQIGSLHKTLNASTHA